MKAKTKSYIISTNEFYTAMDLQRCMNNILPEFGLLALIEDIKGLQENPNLSQSDLILTDTTLSDGDSIPSYRSMSIKTPILIFSAYESYNYDFTNLNVVGFILKPISELELSNALSKIEF